MGRRFLIAADVGNARIKLGLFATPCAATFPEPLRVLILSAEQPELERIEPWLADQRRGELAWWIASVNRPADARLTDWLRKGRPLEPVTLLSAKKLPLEVRLPEPERVGIDRLVDAVAANRLRRPDCAAVIVDAGTAITVDALSPEGAFLGGAILPGMAMSAQALHEYTDCLPLVDPSQLRAPPPPGHGHGLGHRIGPVLGRVRRDSRVDRSTARSGGQPGGCHSHRRRRRGGIRRAARPRGPLRATFDPGGNRTGCRKAFMPEHKAATAGRVHAQPAVASTPTGGRGFVAYRRIFCENAGSSRYL